MGSDARVGVLVQRGGQLCDAYAARGSALHSFARPSYCRGLGRQRRRRQLATEAAERAREQAGKLGPRAGRSFSFGPSFGVGACERCSVLSWRARYVRLEQLVCVTESWFLALVTALRGSL